jgi:hypothetical protein
MRLDRVLLAGALCAVLAAPSVAHGATSPRIGYRTLFQDPGVVPGPDLSLESYAVDLINATPAGERITFALRDFNRQRVADALIAAHVRGVRVDGVIDGGERNRPVVGQLQAGLGADRFVICGSPTFVFNSCIADTDAPSLQHNKFLTFSRLEDGREDVVLQTSMNFLEPTQLNYYNDMVDIAGDHALYEGYVRYLFDLKAQVRSSDHYLITSGDNGRNTMFPSPRAQRDLESDDTIVDRMNEIDCSRGGAPSGRGLVRVANMAFRSERAVILRKLVELKREGCDVEVILSNADGDILAGLVSAGIPVHPFFIRAASPRPQVIVHSKFWLVDAKSTLTGTRRRITYAGSSNWRLDEQRSDDMLLRIVGKGVYGAYSAYWELIRSRAASIQNRPATDAVAPRSALTATPSPNAAGWNRSDVTLRVAASDGHNVGAVGLKRLHVEMTGAQTGSWDLLGEADGYRVEELPITAEGDTTVTWFSEDVKGNVETPRSTLVRIDKTAPAISGVPEICELWPPNHELVHVADISAADALSGPPRLVVSAVDGGDAGDVVINDGSVDLRAEKDPHGRARIYRLRAAAVDAAGNDATASWTCTVAHPRAG